MALSELFSPYPKYPRALSVNLTTRFLSELKSPSKHYSGMSWFDPASSLELGQINQCQTETIKQNRTAFLVPLRIFGHRYLLLSICFVALFSVPLSFGTTTFCHRFFGKILLCFYFLSYYFHASNSLFPKLTSAAPLNSVRDYSWGMEEILTYPGLNPPRKFRVVLQGWKITLLKIINNDVIAI